jgi:cell division protein FtsQ
VLFSSLLALDPGQIAVTGQGTTIDVSAVRAVVAADAGVPMTRINTAGLREKIMVLTGVKDAAVTRQWPHGMAVTLISREPAAAVPVDGGFALFDAEGVQVGDVGVAPVGLPVIDVDLAASSSESSSPDAAGSDSPRPGVASPDATNSSEPSPDAASPDAASPGAQSSSAPGTQALLAALHVFEGLPADIAPQVTEISAATRDDVETTLASGKVVHWGSEERIVLKVDVLRSLLQAAPDAQVYDVSSPDLPVTR